MQHAVCCEKCAAPVATSDEVDPRVSCSEAEEQQLLRRQQREAVGSCGRRDAASQLRAPLRLWFSAFRCFSRKHREFATTEHIFYLAHNESGVYLSPLDTV